MKADAATRAYVRAQIEAAEGSPTPAQVAAAEAKLPDEIVKAIDSLLHASFAAGATNGAWAFSRREIAHAALTATILAHLTAAESAQEVAVAERDEYSEYIIDLECEATRTKASLAAALARAERAEDALAQITNLEASWEATEGPDARMPYELRRAVKIACAALAQPAPPRPR